MTPRIPPVASEDLTPEARELLSQVRLDAPAVNIFTTMVRHPGLMRKWLPWAGKLLNGGKLPGRDRELLIMRTAWRWRSAYEWGQHWLLSEAVQITPDELAAVPAGPDAPIWSEHDATLLRAADELRDEGRISDGTWSALAGVYTEAQMIEVPLLVGSYAAVAYFLNSLGVEPEANLPRMPDQG